MNGVEHLGEDPEREQELEATPLYDSVQERIEGLFGLLRNSSDADSLAGDLEIGLQLSDFEILRPLAEGGMGRVYLAKQLSLDRVVALKVCSKRLLVGDSFYQRFINEGKVLARLNNPYVVPVISQGEQNATLFLVMEYVAGLSLSDIIQGVSCAGSDPSFAIAFSCHPAGFFASNSLAIECVRIIRSDLSSLGLLKNIPARKKRRQESPPSSPT